MPAKKKAPAKGSTKKRPLKSTPALPSSVLFDRVAGILDQARANVVRAVNSHMVLAYWLIGREIVQEIQAGKERAEYGRQVLADLALRLTERYGPGFSETSLRYFRAFYLAYEDRCRELRPPMGDEMATSTIEAGIQRPLGAESSRDTIQRPMGAELALPEKRRQPGSPLQEEAGLSLQNAAGGKSRRDFSPQLNWSHYRALMRVENIKARDFYEEEAIAGGWDKRTLERQVHSFYYERLLRSQSPAKMIAESRQMLTSLDPAIATLKHPYVLEFLGLPEVAALNEEDVESAILSYLQSFLLELGKGFAFVARQKRLRIDDEDHYVDLIFYHIQSRFYLLIDLKIGKLTHQDVGQMDGYVRIFDDQCLAEGDNPTIGLILCTEKNEVVAKYSVLKDRKQIFASKYMLYLPSEEELRREIERERHLIEDRVETLAILG